MPDSNDPEILQARVADARAQITTAVRFACRTYNHGAPPAEVEDFTEDIIKLLLEDDCRRMQTHDPGKGSFKTWLQSVVNHHVSHQLQKHHPAEPLVDELLNTLSYPPMQDQDLLWKEREAIMYAVIDTLSLHDQRIAHLKLQEVPDEEIARELNIKPTSVGREWRVIKTKLTQIVAHDVQSKAKQSKAKQRCSLKKNMQYFFDLTSAFLVKMSIRDQTKRCPVKLIQ
jgi:RNA polymerase sigma factor (sigma-70 family)